MQVDDYGRVGLTELEVISWLRRQPNAEFSNFYLIDAQRYTQARKESFIPVPECQDWNERDQISIRPDSFHSLLQDEWLMPEEYKNLDICQHLLSLCKTDEQIQRVNTELERYEKFNLLNLLRYLKYLRDVADKNEIVWGVGRGSSCCSYCLYLLRIHRVDSMKFNLNITEFLR